ncbi:MAG: hypothetical protein MJ238_05660 [Bacilli bacterium]|nr:hypothetical protein [Bacilli bacterium]
MKKDLTLPTLASLVALLAFSSVGATYAWYQYNANVIIDYNGTSIGSSTVFEVGLVSETPLVGYEDYGLVREEIDGKDVYWCSSEVTTNISKYYLNSNGYATDRLNAVTSGKFSDGDDFALKANPEFRRDYVIDDKPISYIYASKTNFCHFELAFKVNVVTPDGDTVFGESSVNLRTFELESDGNLKKATRIHFSSSECSFIFNPGAQSSGHDTVGGLLDLNNDGVYDCGGTLGGKKENVYGEYETLVYSDVPIENGADPKGMTGNKNCFEAEHKNGCIPVDLDQTVFSVSEYSGISEVISDKRTLSKTNTEGYAFLGMDIYLEGWDSAFVDSEMGHSFNLGLEFECK